MEERAWAMKMIDFKTSIEEAPSFYDIKIDEEGNICYYNEKGEFHRLDGPAIELATGTKAWYVNGKQHRLDGPAVEYVSGCKEWVVDGDFLADSRDGFTDEDFEQWKKGRGL